MRKGRVAANIGIQDDCISMRSEWIAGEALYIASSSIGVERSLEDANTDR